MHAPQPLSYVLDPAGTFTPDPGSCWHCRNSPGYPHRHWTRKREDHSPEPPPGEWQPNWAWRLAFRLYGDGGGPDD